MHIKLSCSNYFIFIKGGNAAVGVSIQKVAEEKLHKRTPASHTSKISLDTVRLPKR